MGNVVAVLGGGRIGRVHVQMLKRYERNARIKYIADPYPTPEMEQWAREYDVPTVITDAEEVFRDPEVNCIFICSPTPTHSNYILQACETGKHVYCEKPLDSDISRIHQAIEAIDRSGIRFLMGFMRRFDKNHQKLRQLVADGELGEPHIIKLCSRDPAPPSYDYINASGGIFFDSMIHDFDLARFFSGSEVVDVYALGNALVDIKIGEIGDVDTAISALRFESGALAIIDLSRRSNCGYDQRAEVHGSKGYAQVTNVPETTVVHGSPSGVRLDKPVFFFLERYANAFAEAQRTFFEMVNEGKESPVTAFDGLQAVRIAMAAKRSLKEKRSVSINDMELRSM